MCPIIYILTSGNKHSSKIRFYLMLNPVYGSYEQAWIHMKKDDLTYSSLSSPYFMFPIFLTNYSIFSAPSAPWPLQPEPLWSQRRPFSAGQQLPVYLPAGVLWRPVRRLQARVCRQLRLCHGQGLLKVIIFFFNDILYFKMSWIVLNKLSDKFRKVANLRLDKFVILLKKIHK